MISHVCTFLLAYGENGSILHTFFYTQNGRTAFRFVRLAVRLVFLYL